MMSAAIASVQLLTMAATRSARARGENLVTFRVESSAVAASSGPQSRPSARATAVEAARPPTPSKTERRFTHILCASRSTIAICDARGLEVCRDQAHADRAIEVAIVLVAIHEAPMMQPDHANGISTANVVNNRRSRAAVVGVA